MDRVRIRRSLIAAGLAAPWALSLPLAAAVTRSADPPSGSKTGWVFLIRHARTVPGVGDPPGFRVEDCSTQRNLSEAGRTQARELGAWFDAQGFALDSVRTSAWCRCIDTAQLAFGRYEIWPALNSFFAGQGERTAQTEEVRAYIAEHSEQRNSVLVTHQVNVSAVSGLGVAMGEVVAFRAGQSDAAVWRVLPVVA